jgi:hypothetical protein
VVLTNDQRVTAIAEFGFSERQARFLELVMRHAGVCVPRQYARFAGIANGGKKCNAFFDQLIRRGYAVGCDCVHNRARLYHVRHRPLYHAIGELESRYRRPVPARRAVERLMLLDAVLATPGLNWITTNAEKARYFDALSTPADHPPLADDAADRPSTPAVEALVGQFPIGLEATGRAVFFFLALVPWTDEFRGFIQAHTRFLRAAREWTVRLVFPRPLDRAYGDYVRVVHEELDTPLHTATVSELKWYFEHRRKAAAEPPDSLTQAFLDRGAQVYSTPRFILLHRRWQQRGDVVFDDASSPVLAEALANGSGRVECLVLPHSYRHLSPLVGLVRSTASGVEKGEHRGEQSSARPQPPASTPSSSR